MLENFREIYKKELENIESPLERMILNSQTVRMFVYEICKNSIISREESKTSNEKKEGRV